MKRFLFFGTLFVALIFNSAFAEIGETIDDFYSSDYFKNLRGAEEPIEEDIPQEGFKGITINCTIDERGALSEARLVYDESTMQIMKHDALFLWKPPSSGLELEALDNNQNIYDYFNSVSGGKIDRDQIDKHLQNFKQQILNGDSYVQSRYQFKYDGFLIAFTRELTFNFSTEANYARGFRFKIVVEKPGYAQEMLRQRDKRQRVVTDLMEGIYDDLFKLSSKYNIFREFAEQKIKGSCVSLEVEQSGEKLADITVYLSRIGQPSYKNESLRKRYSIEGIESDLFIYAELQGLDSDIIPEVEKMLVDIVVDNLSKFKIEEIAFYQSMNLDRILLGK